MGTKYREFEGGTSAVLSNPRTYVRVNDSHLIELRFDAGSNFQKPPFGVCSKTASSDYTSLGATPDEAEAFANEILRVVKDLRIKEAAWKEEQKKATLPKHWPPEPGDVWVGNGGSRFFIADQVALTSFAKRGETFGQYLLKDLIDSVENFNGKYKLVYRKGLDLSKESK